jgi:hypothetical protein
VLSAPRPDLTAAIAAAVSAGPDEQSERAVALGLRALADAAGQPVGPGLRRWAADLASGSRGATPLLGTGLSASPYEALLWNGARFAAVDGSALLLTGLLGGDGHHTLADLTRAVQAGRAVVEAIAWTLSPDDRPDPAGASTLTVGCAAVALLLSSLEPSRLPEVLDVAASLMLVTVAGAGDDGPLVEHVRAGHPLAAGWLSVKSVAAGITPLAGALNHTLSAVAGRPMPEPDGAGPLGGLLARPGGQVRLTEVVEALR